MVQITKLFVAVAALAVPALSLPALESPETNAPALVERTGREVVTCYNSGVSMDRAPIINAITSFCNGLMGQVFENGRVYTQRFDFPYPNIHHIDMKAEVINGCRFTVDNNCYRLLRLPTDGCNTNGENGKQGGYVTDACGRWTMDPNW